MNAKIPSFSLLALILIFNACAPFTTPNTNDEAPAPVLEGVYQPIDVDHVEVEVGVGSPIPVHVIASGSLPDTCAQVELVQQEQEGSDFRIELSTIPSSAEDCVEDPLPFRISLPLNVVNLPAGSYSVEVNGSRADFKLDTADTTSSLPTADSTLTRGDVQVDSVDVEIGQGSPIPVHAIVSLRLPSSCTQLGEIRLHRDGTTFYVRLIAHIAERSDCKLAVCRRGNSGRLEV